MRRALRRLSEMTPVGKHAGRHNGVAASRANHFESGIGEACFSRIWAMHCAMSQSQRQGSARAVRTTRASRVGGDSFSRSGCRVSLDRAFSFIAKEAEIRPVRSNICRLLFDFTHFRFVALRYVMRVFQPDGKLVLRGIDNLLAQPALRRVAMTSLMP